MHSYSMTSAEDPKSVSDAFRFADLPGELRHSISCKYFGTWDAVVEYDRKSAAFKIRGLPEHWLMLANRAMYIECSYLFVKSFSGRLLIRDTKVCRERGFGYVSSLDVLASLCPVWLLRRTQSLVIEHGTTTMLSSLPWHKLSSLQEVQLDGDSLPLAHAFPCGLSAAAKMNREKDVYEGKYDTWRVHGYKSWPRVPKPVSDGNVRVVTVRQGMVNGALLKVRMQHKYDHVEVLDRSINSVIQLNNQDDVQTPSQISEV